MSWWRVNRWGLLLVLPLLAAALAAGSFRLVTLYLPWFASPGTHVEGAVTVTTGSSFVVYPDGEEYTATFTPLDIVPVSSAPDDAYLGDGSDLAAAPGARLWRLTTQVEADPAMSLVECRISLLGPDGTHYVAGLAQTTSDGSVVVPALSAGSCVPTGTPGPYSDLDGRVQPVEEGEERPATYTIDTYVAVPSTVVPDRVRVDMSMGGHWTVDTPGA